MPKYEVYIHEASEARFANYLKRIGGQIEHKSSDARDKGGELAVEWVRQNTQARSLVRAFKEKYVDPYYSTGILQGLMSLMHDTFDAAAGRGYYHWKNDIPWDDVQQALAIAFENSLPPQVPNHIMLGSGRTSDSHLTFRPYSASREFFLPRQVVLLIEGYGLAGGQPKRIPEMAAPENITAAALGWAMKNARGRIGFNPQIREMVLAKPQ